MRKLLYGSKRLDNYVDDLLAHTPAWMDHLVSMRDFLIRVRNAHLTLRPTKCSVGYFCVPYLGHYVGNQMSQTTAEMVAKILQAPKRTD